MYTYVNTYIRTYYEGVAMLVLHVCVCRYVCMPTHVNTCSGKESLIPTYVYKHM